MNFLDAYDVTDPTVALQTTGEPQVSLEEEVAQITGQLSRFWGGFRKQSQVVFENARKDLTEVVSQAQKEITKLATDAPAQDQISRETSSSSTETEGTMPTNKPSDSAEAGPSTEGSVTTDSTPTTPRHNRGPSVSIAAQNLFSRLQSALPSDLAATVQAKLPESIKQGAGAVDFAQLRTTLASEFQRVQGITRAQAEEYVHKSEELLRDAGEFLKEAVKVVPPEEGGAVTPGVMWDGSDIWMLPEFSTPSSAQSGSKGKGKERDGGSSAEGLRAVATRAEALLKQLKHDPEVIRVDPEADERAKQLWDEWLKAEVESKENGMEAKEFADAQKAALDDSVDGEALKKTMDTLVPSAISEETFWKRYFFRVWQVSREEQRRKALLQGTVDNEEVFEWESDDDEATISQKPESAATASKAADERKPSLEVPVAQASVASTPATSSPRRLSSEDSYDVVSSQVSNSGEAKEDDTKVTSGKKTDAKGDDSEDSDWE